MDEIDVPERWRDDTQPTGPLTRAETAKRLGVSTATVRRMEGTLLNPSVDRLGRHLFERAEVYAVAQARARRPGARASDGRLAAKVFTMFEDGAELAEIVIALEIEPLAVRALYQEWRVSLEKHYLRQVQEAKQRAQARSEARAKREADEWERQLANDLRPRALGDLGPAAPAPQRRATGREEPT